LTRHHERDLDHAQQLFTRVAFARALAPGVLAEQVRPTELRARAANGLFAEQVRPHDERPVDVTRDVGEPGLSERAVLAHVFEAADAVVLLALRLAQVAAFSPSRQQAIRRVGAEQLRTLAELERLRGVAGDARDGHFGCTSRCRNTR